MGSALRAGFGLAAICWPLVFGCSGAASNEPGLQQGPMRCNGHEELCDRPLDQVAFAATHNAMSNSDEGWAIPNQVHGLAQQLDDGIRAMLLDTHYWDQAPGQTFLCHSLCELGKIDLSAALGILDAFLDSHPHEVLVLIIEDAISVEDTLAAFEASTLIEHVYAHPGGAFPTLRELIDRGQRLLVTAEREGPPPDWYHHVWDVAWDTPYSFASANDFSCQPNRGSTSNPLFLLNHWIENPVSDPALSEIANQHDLLLGRAEQCQSESGDVVNFVAVNHYSIGALFQVVDELNGF